MPAVGVISPPNAPPGAAEGGWPKPNWLAAGVGAADMGSIDTLPKIDTKSSKGLLEVPAIKLAAAGCDSIVVADRPDRPPPSVDGSSPKSLMICDGQTER